MNFGFFFQNRKFWYACTSLVKFLANPLPFFVSKTNFLHKPGTFQPISNYFKIEKLWFFFARIKASKPYYAIEIRKMLMERGFSFFMKFRKEIKILKILILQRILCKIKRWILLKKCMYVLLSKFILNIFFYQIFNIFQNIEKQI